jgi:DNA-binding LacI/PurR family transcriptional regulator
VPVGIFAEMVGVNIKTLSDILHGRSRLSGPMRIRIERVVGELDRDPPPEAEAAAPALHREERFAPRMRRL